MRIYDGRLGRWLSVDPIAALYPMLTPYQFASNSPIDGIDIDGKEWASETFINLDYLGRAQIITTNYLKIKVINESKLITNPDIIKAKAELFAQSVEISMSNILSPLIHPDEITITRVILDFDPPTTDDLPSNAKLIFDDRKSIVTETKSTNAGITTTNTITNSVPGDTKGAVQGFTIRIAVTMDGKEVTNSELEDTYSHEGGHSAGLNHPWRLSDDEKSAASAINQNDPVLLNTRKDLIKNNRMNSAENPDPNFRTNGGEILTKEQIKVASKNIQKKSSYTKEDLGVIKN